MGRIKDRALIGKEKGPGRKAKRQQAPAPYVGKLFLQPIVK